MNMKKHTQIKRKPISPNRLTATSILSELRTMSTSPAPRISQVAHRLSNQGFDVKRFRTTLEERLKRESYPDPPEGRERRTFFGWLESKHALEVLLRDESLADINACLLLAETVRKDKECEEKNLTGREYPLKFHYSVRSELCRHGARLDKLCKQNGVPETWLSQYRRALDRQCVYECLEIASAKYPGSREDILHGGWSSALCAALYVYGVIEERLKETGLSRRCLRQLTALILRENKICISDEAIRKALARR
jgi:hypothetical protein